MLCFYLMSGSSLGLALQQTHCLWCSSSYLQGRTSIASPSSQNFNDPNYCYYYQYYYDCYCYCQCCYYRYCYYNYEENDSLWFYIVVFINVIINDVIVYVCFLIAGQSDSCFFPTFVEKYAFTFFSLFFWPLSIFKPGEVAEGSFSAQQGVNVRLQIRKSLSVLKTTRQT